MRTFVFRLIYWGLFILERLCFHLGGPDRVYFWLKYRRIDVQWAHFQRQPPPPSSDPGGYVVPPEFAAELLKAFENSRVIRSRPVSIPWEGGKRGPILSVDEDYWWFTNKGDVEDRPN